MIFGIFLVFFGTILSGATAILGNYLGRQVGRKKLSIFHLRPRHTSNVITIATGMLIFMVTILLLNIFSQQVRTRLWAMDSLEADLATKRGEMHTLEQFIQQYMGKMHAEDPVFRYEDVVYVGVVDCALPKESIKEQLNAVLYEGNKNTVQYYNQLAREKGDAPIPDDTKVVGYSGLTARDEAAAKLSTVRGKWLVSLKSYGNIFYPEKVPVTIESRPFLLAFAKDQPIASIRLKVERDRHKILEELLHFLKVDVRRVVDSRGILAPRGQKKVPIDFNLETLVDIRDEILAAQGWVEVRVVANRDIYNTGPLDARLEVLPSGR